MEGNLVDLLLYLAGAALSLAFAYVPGLEAWYKAQNGAVKRLVMLAALALAAGLVVGLACTKYGQVVGLQVGCSDVDAFAVALGFLKAALANQAAYVALPDKAKE